MSVAVTGEPVAAKISDPAPGSELSSTIEIFVWNDAGAEQYWLWIGTSAGDNDIYSDRQSTNYRMFIYGLPNNGATLYVRLFSMFNGEWQYNDCTYTAYNPTAAALQSPTPGSSLTSASATFTWSDAGADQYWLWIGTSAGDNDIYSDSQGTNNEKLVNGLPKGGETLYMRLFSMFDGEWLHNDYTYTAYNLAPSVMQSPSPGSTLGLTSATFTWSNVGATQYWLWIGTSGAGSNDVYSDGQGTNNSKFIAILPGSGETLYVRLWSNFSGEWVYNDYTYTASGGR